MEKMSLKIHKKSMSLKWLKLLQV